MNAIFRLLDKVYRLKLLYFGHVARKENPLEKEIMVNKRARNVLWED